MLIGSGNSEFKHLDDANETLLFLETDGRDNSDAVLSLLSKSDMVLCLSDIEAKLFSDSDFLLPEWSDLSDVVFTEFGIYWVRFSISDIVTFGVWTPGRTGPELFCIEFVVITVVCNGNDILVGSIFSVGTLI